MIDDLNSKLINNICEDIKNRRSKFQYIGPPNQYFIEKYYDLEFINLHWDCIKFKELNSPITIEFFFSNFEEITDNDIFHEKLLNEVLDIKTTSDT